MRTQVTAEIGPSQELLDTRYHAPDPVKHYMKLASECEPAHLIEVRSKPQWSLCRTCSASLQKTPGAEIVMGGIHLDLCVGCMEKLAAALLDAAERLRA